MMTNFAMTPATRRESVPKNSPAGPEVHCCQCVRGGGTSTRSCRLPVGDPESGLNLTGRRLVRSGQGHYPAEVRGPNESHRALARPRNPRCPGIGAGLPRSRPSRDSRFPESRDPDQTGIPDFPNPGFQPNRDARIPEIRDSSKIGIQIRENPDFLQRPEP